MDHVRRRRVLRRSKCSCGLSWPCPDGIVWRPNNPVPDGWQRPPDSAGWNCPTTILNQLGRAGALTPAQALRARRKRSLMLSHLTHCLPFRPSWECDDCGQPWPCLSANNDFGVEFFRWIRSFTARAA